MNEILSPPEFGRQLFRLGTAWRREIDVRMRRFGLTDATWRPLLHLGRLGDGVRQTDLAASLDIEGPSLVRLLDVLERANLIERVEDAEDRRSKRVRMTEAGHALYSKLYAVYEDLSRFLLDGATAAELDACRSLFAKLERAIERRHIEERGA
jgi:MarR family transcriptional regulator, transcriptional regulator for hemolysin